MAFAELLLLILHNGRQMHILGNFPAVGLIDQVVFGVEERYSVPRMMWEIFIR